MPITYLPEALSGEKTDEALRERLAARALCVHRS